MKRGLLALALVVALAGAAPIAPDVASDAMRAGDRGQAPARFAGWFVRPDRGFAIVMP